MSESTILAFSDLPRAWSAYQERASRLAQYVDRLEQQILDGGKVLPSAEERYATNTPRNFQSVPLFVARLVRSRELRDAAELKDEDVQSALKRDQLDEIPFDPLNSEKSGPGRDVRRESIGLAVFASSVAQPGLRVLSGGAGSGKTYLVLFTVVQLLRQWRLHGRRIPILCAAEDLAKRLPRNLKDEGAAAYRWGQDAKVMARNIVDAALGRPWMQGEDRSAVRDRLVELILQGKAVVVVDGLDQAYSSCDRLAVLLQEFAKDLKGSVLLVARPYALASILNEKFPLDRTFETLRWREHQIRAFAACHNRPDAEAQELAALSRNPASAETVAVPQLLAFVVSLLKNKKLRNVAEAKTLTRAELYDRLITSRLEKVNRNDLAGRMRRISEFALKEWRESQRSVRRLRGNPKVKGAYRDLLTSGLISNKVTIASETQEAEWSHRSILEFFVARGLVDRVLKADDRSAAVQAMATLGFDPGCHELLRFAYGSLLKQRPDLATALLGELADEQKDDGALSRLSVATLLTHEADENKSLVDAVAKRGLWATCQHSQWNGPLIALPFVPFENTQAHIFKSHHSCHSLITSRISRMSGPSEINDTKEDSSSSDPCEGIFASFFRDSFNGISSDIQTNSSLFRILGNSSLIPYLRHGREDASEALRSEILYTLCMIGDVDSISDLQERFAYTITTLDESAFKYVEVLTLFDRKSVDRILYDRMTAVSSSNLFLMNSIDWNTIKFISMVLEVYIESRCGLLNESIGSVLYKLIDFATKSEQWIIARDIAKLLRACTGAVQIELIHKLLVRCSIGNADAALAVAELASLHGIPIDDVKFLKESTIKGIYKRSVYSTDAGRIHLIFDNSMTVEVLIHAAIRYEMDPQVLYYLMSSIQWSNGSEGTDIVTTQKPMTYLKESLESKWHPLIEVLGCLTQENLDDACKLTEILSSLRGNWTLLEYTIRLFSYVGNSASTASLLAFLHEEAPNWSRNNRRSKEVVLDIIRCLRRVPGKLGTGVDSESMVQDFKKLLDIFKGDMLSLCGIIEILGVIDRCDTRELLSKAFKSPEMRSGSYQETTCVAMGRVGLDIPLTKGFDDLWSVQCMDFWCRGASKAGQLNAIHLVFNEHPLFFEAAPGLRLRTCWHLLNSLPPDQPRHWINGEFKRTEDLVVLDF